MIFWFSQQMQSLNINNPAITPQIQTDPMCDKIAKTIQNYLFNYPERIPVNIHESTLSNTILLLIRLISFIYLSAIYLWTLYSMDSIFTNVEYLTLIGYFCTWFYFALCIQDYIINHNTVPLSKKLGHYIELVHQIAFCAQVPITLVFWSVLFKILLDMPDITTEIIILNANLHGGPMLCLLLQFFFNPFSFSIRHIPVLIIFDIIYFLINLIYSIQVKPIYKPINWVSAVSYIITTISVFLTLFIHYLARLAHRKWKINRLYPDNRRFLLTSEQTIGNNYVQPNIRQSVGNDRL